MYKSEEFNNPFIEEGYKLNNTTLHPKGAEQ